MSHAFIRLVRVNNLATQKSRVLLEQAGEREQIRYHSPETVHHKTH